MSQVHAYIVGQAQASYHNEASVDHPFELMHRIAKDALDDAGVSPEEVDAIGCVDPFSWTYADLGEAVAAKLGAGEVRDFWLPAGGTTPQDLLHEIAQAMANGEIDVAILVGAEAMRTRRKASRAGETLPWPPRDKSVSPTRGQKPFTSEWEAKHGLRLPIQSFPILENAIRAANGRSNEAQIEIAAGLLHKNALVAANNPHAWFQDAPSIEEIGTVTADNRMISYPYTKRMNAIMDVDQTAALVVVSDRLVEKFADRAIAVLGGAGAEEIWNPIERESFSHCKAMEVSFDTALAHAGLSASDINAFDFYSCFPSPVQMALSAMNMEVSDDREFSITGGLAYAGGPGNNYVMHSLATAVARLRERKDERIMITGVGMANTKHAATLLSHAGNVPASASGKTEYRVPTGAQALNVQERASGDAKIASYTIEYDRDGAASNVIYILDLENGNRAIANARDSVDAEVRLFEAEPIGRSGHLVWDDTDDRQYFELS